MLSRLLLQAAISLPALSLLLASAAGAEALRLVAADDRGVTLELAFPDYALRPAGEGGRARLAAPGLTAHALPGRPVLPSATTLVGLPPGARAALGVLDGAEELREGVRLVLGERRGFAPDAGGMGYVPVAEAAEPIRDGPWPRAPVEVGAPFTLRAQRLVAVTLHPFRYDEATGRLWSRRRMRVRIDFVGATTPAATLPARDPHWDPVLRQAMINFEQGRRWRVAPLPATRGGRPEGTTGGGTLLDRTPGPAAGAAAVQFDEGEPEVRVQTDSTGVYALDYDALAAKGYPAGVPIREVSVHRHEFLEDAIPAYRTVELPIEVDEAQPANGVFDTGDRIVVFVRSWAERSGATLPQRAWGDGEVIYVTRVARGGLRIDGRRGWRDATGLPLLASSPWTQRWEKNLVYMSFPGTAPAESTFDQFHWTNLLPYYLRPDSFRFEINHLDATRPVRFTAAWQGRTAGTPYFTWAQVRNGLNVHSVVADSVLWSGKSNLVVNATLAGGAVTEGLTNSLLTWGRSAIGPPDPFNNARADASLNWFEATYWRAYRAIENYLPCNSGDALGAYEILASGFDDSTALRAYDISNPDDPRRLSDVRREPDGAGFALRLQDEALPGAPRRYFIFSRPKPVPAARITAVTRRGLATGAGGDYLVITPEAWRGAVQPLVSLRAAQGLAVKVSPLEALFDEFNGGRRSAWAIKRYLRFALNTWGAKFVLLVGDGSEDPLNHLRNSGPDIVPVYKIPGPVGIFLGREIVPSDGWYVWCLNGCERDPQTGQAPPILPELFIGRLPVITPQEVADAVAKLVAYESFSPDQAWRNEMLLLSDDEFSGTTTFGGGGGGSGYCQRFGEDRFRLLNETIRAAIIDLAGLRRTRVEHFDVGYWLRNEPVVGGCRPDRAATQSRTRATVTPALLARLNAGRMWWNYQGHANEFVMGHEDFYRNIGSDDDKDLLVNDGMPFLFSAFSCHANAFAHAGERRIQTGPAFGEELVVMPRRGAIASFASVGFEILPDNGTDHINVAWARAMFVDPPHDELLGERGARTVLGESIALAFLRYVPRVQFDPTENGIALTYTLLGDPATRISIGAPQAIVTANGDTVASNRPVALAPPRDTLHLEADLASNVEIRTITLLESSSAGERVVPATDYTLTPAFPDTGSGGRGGRRYHLSYTTPMRAGVMRYTIRSIDRYGLQNDFNLVFPFFIQLRVSGNPLVDDDPVSPAADLSLALTLPTPISDPAGQIVLEVDSLAQAFTSIPTDTTGRGWILQWAHDPYPVGTHVVRLTALDSLQSAHRFRVVDPGSVAGRLLQQVFAFPNPFDEQVGTSFSYYLISDGPADVMLRLFTVSGRLIYQRVERGVAPGYHQWPWNGLDADGDRLANGVYLYRMVATTDTRSDTFDGRLVKLRKPRRGDTPAP